MNFFYHSGKYKVMNENKTVAINVARNALMFMEKQDFIKVRGYFLQSNISADRHNESYRLAICDKKYSLLESDSLGKCENIRINNVSYKVSIYPHPDKHFNQDQDPNYYMPIQVKVEWEGNENENEKATTLDGTIKSEDLR